MHIPVLPVALVGIALTFALALLGWWLAQRVERRRRAARRLREADRNREEHGEVSEPEIPGRQPPEP